MCYYERMSGAGVPDSTKAYLALAAENGRLWYRSVLFSLGNREAMRLEVILHHDNGPQTAELDSVYGRYSRAVARHGALDVVVTTAGPAGSTSTLARQATLAAEPALART